MTENDGGTAFPVLTGLDDARRYNSKNEPGFVARYTDGMTLRDYFAAKSLVAICASKMLDAATNACCDMQKRPHPDVIAELAYAFADAMLAERAK